MFEQKPSKSLTCQRFLNLLIMGLIMFSTASFAEGKLNNNVEQPLESSAKPNISPAHKSHYLTSFQQVMDLSQNPDLKTSEDVLAQWAKLQAEFPADKAVANNYAVYLMRIGRIEAARAKLEQALRYDADGEVLMQNLNAVYAYQAQKSYQDLFKKTAVTTPKTVWASANKTPAYSNVQAQLDLVENNMDKVLASVENWRLAWSSQSASAYLAFYEPGFLSVHYPSHEAWVKGRESSLQRPKFIKITLKDFVLTPLANDLIQVKFKQHYRSNRFNDEVLKSMVWQQQEGNWKIVNERVIKRAVH